MNVLILGSKGQLGRSLADTAPASATLTLASRNEIDLLALNELHAKLESVAPDAIINAAAYTAVDKAEEESAKAEVINAEAVGIIATYCKKASIPLIHISTDFVFKGDKGSAYTPDDPTDPINSYGRSKLMGEQVLREANSDAWIIRSSWIYSEHGHNFVKTMLRLAANKTPLTVVDDQFGSPTYARNLANFIWGVLDKKPAPRLLHYSDAGITNWHDFAVAIFAEAEKSGILKKMPDISPISTAGYPLPAPRPAFSGLDCSSSCEAVGIAQAPWREALCDMLARLNKG